MATVLITGGTGLVGTALTKALEKKGYDVIILTRDPSKYTSAGKVRYAKWDIDKSFIDAVAMQHADAIVHLAGEGVADKRWTEERKKQIQESRTKTSALLIKKMQEFPNKIKTVVSASAIGWYGEDKVVPSVKSFIETDAAATDFLGETCRLWEDSIHPVTSLGKRLVKLRTGIVLSNDGGAYKEFKNPMRFGVAAILGSGKQIVSWIHIDDLVKMYIDAIENEKLQGAYNAVAPNPVSNKELVLSIAKARKKFHIPMHVSSFVLKIMLGEMSIEVLKSATVSADKILQTGFAFNYKTIEEATHELES